ncbi:CwfJ C-terminus 2-domain-containing protein-like protein, partial [Baffinella frigidus]
WREDDDLQKEQYVFFESGIDRSTLLHVVPQGHRHPLNFAREVGHRHPLNFAREVVARLLDMPERADWKTCSLTMQEEEQQALAFKEMFKPYDWSLLEDDDE